MPGDVLRDCAALAPAQAAGRGLLKQGTRRLPPAGVSGAFSPVSKVASGLGRWEAGLGGGCLLLLRRVPTVLVSPALTGEPPVLTGGAALGAGQDTLSCGFM